MKLETALHVVVSKDLNHELDLLESAIHESMIENNIQNCSLSILGMSRIHLITTEEVDRIYRGLSKTARGGHDYGEKSLYDDLEDFVEAINLSSICDETMKLFFLHKCARKDWKSMALDEKKLNLYIDYKKFKRNPDVPIELLAASSSTTRFCFSSACRETRVINLNQ